MAKFYAYEQYDIFNVRPSLDADLSGDRRMDRRMRISWKGKRSQAASLGTIASLQRAADRGRDKLLG
jgi:hypothetical protein